MKPTRRLTLALLALVAGVTVAQAQAPRTITFQGRARDASGAYVDDQRSVTIGIYAVANGGNPLFSETQNVKFDKGTFTLAIGGATPGGIPATLRFDRQYWVGVQVENFNGGVELEPRLRLHSVPYSLRTDVADLALNAQQATSATTAEQADSSRVAGTAVTLTLPAVVQGSTGSAAVTITNASDTALRVKGAKYGIISDGIDSTTKYFAAGDTAGANKKPAPGAYYRDNAAMAWGLIDRDGTLLSDFGLLRVTRTGLGTYEVVLENQARTFTPVGSTAGYPILAPVITPGGGNEPLPVLARWSFSTKTGTPDLSTVIVQIFDIQGRPSDSPFSIVIFGRP
jgi:hypothetical protein